MRERQKPGGVRAADGIFVVGDDQLLQAELTDRFEHAEAGIAFWLLRLPDQTLLDEPGDAVE